MEVKEAVALAKEHLASVYTDEKISNLGLEEVEFNNGQWDVTLGFSRPWDSHPMVVIGGGPLGRSYKTVVILDKDKRVLSIRDRKLVSA